MRKCITLLIVISASICFAQNNIHNRVTPIVEAYKSAEESIVNISGMRVVSSQPRELLDWRNFFGPQKPRQYIDRFELGSGFVVHEDGYIVTNAHVIQTAEKLGVTFTNGKEYEAQVISTDETKDLAFLKIESEDKFKAIKLGTSCDLMIGETVIAVGNPFGYSNSVTSGIISAVGRDIHVREDFWLRGLIQTSAPINPGNSGGPLLNINGELIGINTAIRQQAQNIGFAIPVDTLTDNLIEMLMPEKLRRVRFGIVIGSMQKCGTGEGYEGLAVNSVSPDTPAFKQGLQTDDLIIGIDGKPVNGFIDFYVHIMDKDINEAIELECFRPSERKLMKFSLKLEYRPIPDGKEICKKFFQFDISELNEAMARKFEFANPYPVLIVTEVSKNGVGDEGGLKAGDVILSVNSRPVEDIESFSLEMEKVQQSDTVEFQILRIGWWAGTQVQRHYRVRLKAQSGKQIEDKILL